jgi:hypothetical protein
MLWNGLGAVIVGIERQGCDVNLVRQGRLGWQASVYSPDGAFSDLIDGLHIHRVLPRCSALTGTAKAAAGRMETPEAFAEKHGIERAG